LDDTCWKLYHPKKQSGHQKNKESTWGDRTYREIVSEIFCARKNIATDESAFGFKGKIIFKIYNKKPQRSGASDYLH
jgi:hypothetical protein